MNGRIEAGLQMVKIGLREYFISVNPLSARELEEIMFIGRRSKRKYCRLTEKCRKDLKITKKKEERIFNKREEIQCNFFVVIIGICLDVFAKLFTMKASPEAIT